MKASKDTSKVIGIFRGPLTNKNGVIGELKVRDMGFVIPHVNTIINTFGVCFKESYI